MVISVALTSVAPRFSGAQLAVQFQQLAIASSENKLVKVFNTHAVSMNLQENIRVVIRYYLQLKINDIQVIQRRINNIASSSLPGPIEGGFGPICDRRLLGTIRTNLLAGTIAGPLRDLKFTKKIREVLYSYFDPRELDMQAFFTGIEWRVWALFEVKAQSQQVDEEVISSQDIEPKSLIPIIQSCIENLPPQIRLWCLNQLFEHTKDQPFGSFVHNVARHICAALNLPDLNQIVAELEKPSTGVLDSTLDAALQIVVLKLQVHLEDMLPHAYVRDREVEELSGFSLRIMSLYSEKGYKAKIKELHRNSQLEETSYCMCLEQLARSAQEIRPDITKNLLFWVEELLDAIKENVSRTEAARYYLNRSHASFLEIHRMHEQFETAGLYNLLLGQGDLVLEYADVPIHFLVGVNWRVQALCMKGTRSHHETQESKELNELFALMREALHRAPFADRVLMLGDFKKLTLKENFYGREVYQFLYTYISELSVASLQADSAKLLLDGNLFTELDRDVHLFCLFLKFEDLSSRTDTTGHNLHILLHDCMVPLYKRDGSRDIKACIQELDIIARTLPEDSQYRINLLQLCKELAK